MASEKAPCPATILCFLLLSCFVSEAAAEKHHQQCHNHVAHKQALFGDLHVHTSYSYDAAAISLGTTPVDAYRYARGEPIDFFPLDSAGNPVGKTQIDRALDFVAVTDHAEFLGETRLCTTEESPAYDSSFCQTFRADRMQGMLLLAAIEVQERPQRITGLCGPDGSVCDEYASPPWQSIQRAANEADHVCEFTTFVAYEYTGTPNVSSYHRNVIFRNSQVPALPVSFIDATLDTELWVALDQSCQESSGCEYLTIPHNTNQANGRFAPYQATGSTIAEKRKYAATRLAREPVMEIFQHKGNSECFNGIPGVIGAPDELCDQEAVMRLGEQRSFDVPSLQRGQLVFNNRTDTTSSCIPGQVRANGAVGSGCVDATDFHRSALLVGLAEAMETGINPIKLGVVAATDTHISTPGNVQESSWEGSVSGEASPQQRLEPGLMPTGINGNPGGLTGVWATENTRDAIFDALLRKEVFGTSGPRIQLRLFAGWDYDENMCKSENILEAAYRKGVPMGADLIGEDPDRKPVLLAWAAQDPMGQKLQSLQVIKGWIDDQGNARYKVIEVADDDEGAGDFCTIYTDRSFDPTLPAYYYLRAVELPTPRWHTYDCERLAKNDQPQVCAKTDTRYQKTIRETAWSSPIWYHHVKSRHLTP